MLDHKLEYEKKYVLPNIQAPEILSLLSSLFAKDGEYYTSYVYSLYFDSPELNFLYEKIDSDFHKRKIRLRWYQDHPEDGAKHAYLESKIKFGDKRQKERLKLALDIPPTSELSLDSPLWQQIQQQSNIIAPNLEFQLKPILLIQYTRHRFVLNADGTRICLDSNINCPKVNGLFLPNYKLNQTLDEAVFEIKGSHFELPKELHFLYNRGLYKTSFSKYQQCFEMQWGSI